MSMMTNYFIQRFPLKRGVKVGDFIRSSVGDIVKCTGFHEDKLITDEHDPNDYLGDSFYITSRKKNYPLGPLILCTNIVNLSETYKLIDDYRSYIAFETMRSKEKMLSYKLHHNHENRVFKPIAFISKEAANFVRCGPITPDLLEIGESGVIVYGNSIRKHWVKIKASCGYYH